MEDGKSCSRCFESVSKSKHSGLSVPEDFKISVTAEQNGEKDEVFFLAKQSALSVVKWENVFLLRRKL